MPIENAVYVDTLDPSFPGSGESKTQGDDHLRLIKGVLKRTFPSVASAITLTATVINGLPARLAALEGQFLVSTLIQLAKDLDCGGFGLVNLKTPTQGADAVTKAYVDALVTSTAVANRLPLNFVLLTMTNVNPGAAVGSGGLGYGTWTQLAQGRFLSGVGTGTDQNGATATAVAGNTGGEYVHTLTLAQVPAELLTNIDISPPGGLLALGTALQRVQTFNTGGGQPFNVTPPAFGVYVWQRTA